LTKDAIAINGIAIAAVIPTTVSQGEQIGLSGVSVLHILEKAHPGVYRRLPDSFVGKAVMFNAKREVRKDIGNFLLVNKLSAVPNTQKTHEYDCHDCEYKNSPSLLCCVFRRSP
jgi:hypothetical protein